MVPRHLFGDSHDSGNDGDDEETRLRVELENQRHVERLRREAGEKSAAHAEKQRRIEELWRELAQLTVAKNQAGAGGEENRGYRSVNASAIIVCAGPSISASSDECSDRQRAPLNIGDVKALMHTFNGGGLKGRHVVYFPLFREMGKGKNKNKGKTAAKIGQL